MKSPRPPPDTWDKSESLGVLPRNLHFSKNHRWLACTVNLTTTSFSLAFRLQFLFHDYQGITCKIALPFLPSTAPQIHLKVFVNVLVFPNRSTHNTHCALPFICHLPEATLEAYSLSTLDLNWPSGFNWLKSWHEVMSKKESSTGFHGFKILHYHCLTECFEQILLPLCFFSIKCKLL